MSDVPVPPPIPSALPWRFKPGRTVKFALVGVLLLLLLIPHAMIASVISEREGYQEEARSGIAGSWGPAQTVLGPVLVVPTRTEVPRAPNETGPLKWERGAVTVLPAELEAQARLAPERRRRGLFEAVVYGADVLMSAKLSVPALTVPERTELLWREAFMLTGATSLRSAAGTVLTLNGRALPARDAGCDFGNWNLVRWDLGLDGAIAPDTAMQLAGAMSLRGTGRFGLAPLARQARFDIAAPWPTPSFTGSGLPVRSDITPQGFTASWEEGTGQPLVSRGGPGWCEHLVGEAPRVGVDLLEAVPTYRMVTRASKYAELFLALALLTYVLFELVAGVRIHLVQYGLLGLSVLLFPLLLLAFGEPLGFATAYAISSAAVVAQASAYTAAVTHRLRLAGVFAGILGTLFGFLYVVLSLEAFALLAGAVALFAALSAVMAVTRRVNWAEG